jgi:hypothetical protein
MTNRLWYNGGRWPPWQWSAGLTRGVVGCAWRSAGRRVIVCRMVPRRGSISVLPCGGTKHSTLQTLYLSYLAGTVGEQSSPHRCSTEKAVQRQNTGICFYALEVEHARKGQSSHHTQNMEVTTMYGFVWLPVLVLQHDDCGLGCTTRMYLDPHQESAWQFIVLNPGTGSLPFSR